MMQRTTLTAEAADLDLFRREARRRGVSLNAVLNEIVHDAATERRERNRPRDFALFDGPGNVVEEMLRDKDAPYRESVAQASVDDEESPARGRLRS